MMLRIASTKSVVEYVLLGYYPHPYISTSQFAFATMLQKVKGLRVVTG